MSVGTAPRAVTEEPTSGDIPLWIHPDWSTRFPWLVQGTTGSGTPASPFDLGLAGRQPVGEVLNRWGRLREMCGVSAAVHSRQVHGADLLHYEISPPPGLTILEGVDGHMTGRPDLLLTVSVADCVPVSLVAPDSRTIALVHAGWRGTAAGILERAIQSLVQTFGILARDLWMHCGPAICNKCYEVGTEVHAAVNPERPAPNGPEPIDLRGSLADRGARMGVDAAKITVSSHCTRCGPGEFFSHRGGSPARQMGILAVRA